MTSSKNSTGTGSHQVGRVASLHDKVKAISDDGTERQLSVDSPIFAHDRIITEEDGRISIMIHDTGSQIDLKGTNDVIIDDDIFGDAGSEVIAGAAAEIELVQEAFFFMDVDLTAVVEESTVDSFYPTNEGHAGGDFDQVTTHKTNNSVSGNTEKISVIFHESDYANLDGVIDDDLLKSMLDPDDSNT